MPAFGMSNELDVQLVNRHPDRFVALCAAKETQDRAVNGEIEWTIEEAAAELDRHLSTGNYVGIGEGTPPLNPIFAKKERVSVNERLDEICKVMDVARKHGCVPVRMHTGSPMGYQLSYGVWPENFHPIMVNDIAQEYPDVPIIFDHGGMQGWWWEHLVDQCCFVAASHDNVYLETGMYWTDLYYKPLSDPNIGAEKLIWGTDWGASIPIYTQYGRKPQTYPVQVRKDGIPHYQPDIMGWSLSQVSRLDISQDDRNLILGGNAARIYKLDVPYTRLFRPV
jgi:predicted TIM-barrel fold metal-dependent hydrolase